MKSNRVWKLGFLSYLTAIVLLMPKQAFAYVDPSVTSYAIQAIVGIVVAIGAFVAVYWRHAKKKVQNKLGIDTEAGKEKEDAVEVYTESKDTKDTTPTA